MRLFRHGEKAEISMSLIVNKLYHSYKKNPDMPRHQSREIGGGSWYYRRIPLPVRLLHLMEHQNQHLMLKTRVVFITRSGSVL